MEKALNSIVAFIPVRGGSKSIPGKNIRPIAGRPLVYWVLDAATQCASIDRVYVATDDEQIRNVVTAYGSAKVEVIGRSAATATDTASTESAMIEFAQARDFSHMVLIQATSPLLRAEDLTKGIDLLKSNGADSLVSGVEQKRFIWQVDEKGMGTPQNYDPVRRPRRQDFHGYFVENGAFYVSSRKGLLETQSRLHGRIVACPMPEETYYELDEPTDWIVIEHLLKLRLPDAALALTERLKNIRILLTDVDGVLTDAGMYYTNDGNELKKFNTRDGKAFELLRAKGIKVGIVTAEDTQIVANRARKLKADYLFQGVKDKQAVVTDLLKREGFTPDQLAYTGDDLNDLEVIKLAGFGACPADAVGEVKKAARYICAADGGRGVVREVAEMILGVNN